MTTPSPQWKKTACILCSLNCGLEVQTENGRISKIRGDDDHPASQGYVCEKSQRMDYYQNGADRLDTPMRRRTDGSYEAIDWDTAIREVAEKFLAIKRRHGGESILYYGGGAQGNHLGGAYGDSTLKALGVKYRSNALAQEKTGEFWVQGKMFGTGVHGDFEHCEVAILIGKNPWQSHGFARARVLLNAMAKDPARSIIVIDPRLSETAALADFHLQIRPGTDAWCLAALVGIIVQDGLLARDWLAEHTSGYEHIVDELNAIPVAYCAETCGVAEDKLRAAARRIASASSVSPAHARSHARPGVVGGDRRGHDRDRAPRRLRAAGGEPVRKGRGDLLQPGIPAQRLPPARAAVPGAYFMTLGRVAAAARKAAENALRPSFRARRNGR